MYAHAVTLYRGVTYARRAAGRLPARRRAETTYMDFNVTPHPDDMNLQGGQFPTLSGHPSSLLQFPGFSDRDDLYSGGNWGVAVRHGNQYPVLDGYPSHELPLPGAHLSPGLNVGHGNQYPVLDGYPSHELPLPGAHLSPELNVPHWGQRSGFDGNHLLFTPISQHTDFGRDPTPVRREEVGRFSPLRPLDDGYRLFSDSPPYQQPIVIPETAKAFDTSLLDADRHIESYLQLRDYNMDNI